MPRRYFIDAYVLCRLRLMMSFMPHTLLSALAAMPTLRCHILFFMLFYLSPCHATMLRRAVLRNVTTAYACRHAASDISFTICYCFRRFTPDIFMPRLMPFAMMLRCRFVAADTLMPILLSLCLPRVDVISMITCHDTL